MPIAMKKLRRPTANENGLCRMDESGKIHSSESVAMMQGGVAEWPIALVLKTSVAKVTAGSNPAPSAFWFCSLESHFSASNHSPTPISNNRRRDGSKKDHTKQNLPPGPTTSLNCRKTARDFLCVDSQKSYPCGHRRRRAAGVCVESDLPHRSIGEFFPAKLFHFSGIIGGQAHNFHRFRAASTVGPFSRLWGIFSCRILLCRRHPVFHA